jgi:hypothetical protein
VRRLPGEPPGASRARRGVTVVWMRATGGAKAARNPEVKAAHAFVDGAPQCHVARRPGQSFVPSALPLAGAVCTSCLEALRPSKPTLGRKRYPR